MKNDIKHGIILAVVGVLIFIGVGTMITKVNCGLGPKSEEEYTNGTQKRSDDYSFFAHFVCTAERNQHNR